MRYFLLTLAAAAIFALGIFAGRPQQVPPVQETPPALRDTVRGKLQAICDSDLTDYYRLKTLEERYKMADEILGKVIKIFLADLGLHLSPKTLSSVRDALAQQTPERPAPESAAQAGNGKTTIKSPDAKPTSTSAAPDPTKEEALANIRDEQDVNDLLSKLRIGDLYAALRSTTDVSSSNENFLAIAGKFSGTANVTKAGANKLWTIDLTVSITKREEKLAGSMSLILSENGKAFSSKSGDGDVSSDFKEFGNGSQALLIHASPSRYLQIYYLKSMDAIAGNFYESEKDNTQFNFIGTTLMHRVGR